MLSKGDVLYHFGFWILDWAMPDQLTVPGIEIMQVQTKMVLELLILIGEVALCETPNKNRQFYDTTGKTILGTWFNLLISSSLFKVFEG